MRAEPRQKLEGWPLRPSILPPPAKGTGERPRLADRLARIVVRALLRRLSGRRVLVEDRSGNEFFVRSYPESEQTPDLEATVTVHDARSYLAALRDRSAGLGHAYVQGWWDSDDLTALFRILTRSLQADGNGRTDKASRLLRACRGARSSVARTTTACRETTLDQVRAHYDISDELFTAFLDPTLTYSCAVFEGQGSSLQEASLTKLDRICRKLELKATDRVLEIGTGWGSFALYAACRYGCSVTTTTVSERQYEAASERVGATGLQGRVTVLKSDYKQLSGRWDKVVSIEMIEALDWREYDDYFASCANLLEPTGLMALQAIVISPRHFDRSKRSADFIKKMVFPGSCLPSVDAIVRSASRAGSLRIIDLEDIGDHYAETLSRWRQNLERNTALPSFLVPGEPLRRLWDMYLGYCEAGFREGRISDVQVVMAGEGRRAATLAPRAL